MKTAFLLSTLLVGVHSFAPVTRQQGSAPLFAAIAEEDMSDAQKEIKGIQAKWTEIRHLSREEAKEQLDGDWLEAHTRFFDQYDSDMERMEEIVTKLEKQIEPPRVEKKTKGQKRRDAYARKLARAGEAA
mmetsp:Transcript_15978/g.32752  ORF Transcript_15978/g.32752 Transcript_15978/m.32752 type:complete len:130 (+) Transcript_15978:136-525(+)